MCNPAPHTHHAIDYVEIYTTDMDRSRHFYEAAFDWRFHPYGPDYAGIARAEGSGEAGGLCKVDAVTPGGPLVVLYSHDLEATSRAVEAAGGSISKPIFPFPGGRRFHFRDPSGNELAVWTEANA